MSKSETPAPTRGVPVELDRPRHLRYTLAIRRELLELLGGEEQLRTNLGGDKLGTILQLGLKHEDPEITVEAVEEMVDMQNILEVVTAMSKALGYKGSKITTGTEERSPTPPAPPAEVGDASVAQ